MKLFTNRKAAVPSQTRPDYEMITTLERELKPPADDFDERYDRMLLDEFNKVNKNSTLQFDEKIEKLYDLMDSMFSTRYRNAVVTMIESARANRFPEGLERHSFEWQVANLKARMIERGKRRK
ncbi:hypothetical protein SEA_SHAM_247 [Streptomyces phage Sham]|nr:hypothetical protein SEA_SHAM_247 [Streptomyces phage Sham]